jgi:glycosyltransferase involved in cell wall biosynthesis
MEKEAVVSEKAQEAQSGQEKQLTKNEIIENAVNNLKENKFSTYFYCPSLNAPSGGIGVLLKFARILKDEGVDVKIVYEPVPDQKRTYEESMKQKKQIDVFQLLNPTWVDFDISDIDFLPLGDKKINVVGDDGNLAEVDCHPLTVKNEDFLIIPEGFPNIMEKTSRISCKRIVLAQSWFYILNALQPGQKWQHFGIGDVISVSDAITEYLQIVMPGLKIKSFKQGINRDIFKAPEKISEKFPMVGFSGGRGEEAKMKTVNIIKMFYSIYPHLQWVRFMELSGMEREEFAERLSNCAFYLYTDDIAGFGTAPLEAMACGTHVVGWTPFGGKEYYNEQNGFWVPNGDIFAAAEMLGIVIDKWLNSELDGPEMMEEYEKTLKNYTPEIEKEQIINIINQYKDERISELEGLKDK